MNGIPIICIKNDNNTKLLTIGKIYMVETWHTFDHVLSDHQKSCYIVTCNNGYAYWIETEYFMTLSEYREKKLNRILNGT